MAYIDDLKREVITEGGDYKKYFRSKLAQFGVKSPNQLPPEKKKAFFNSVDKGWKGEKTSESNDLLSVWEE